VHRILVATKVRVLWLHQVLRRKYNGVWFFLPTIGFLALVRIQHDAPSLDVVVGTSGHKLLAHDMLRA
jgi:hypothetical protein